MFLVKDIFFVYLWKKVVFENLYEIYPEAWNLGGTSLWNWMGI